MDFSRLRQLIIPEGYAKELWIAGTLFWRKAPAYGVEITTDNSSPMTGFYYLQSTSITFTADYNIPAAQQDETPVWTIDGLPEGISAEALDGDSLTVSGYPESSGDFTLTVSVSKGNYSDTKTYTLTIENVDYGISITTSNDSTVTDFTIGNYASKTFTANINVPPREQNTATTWTFANLPAGLSDSGATVRGTAAAFETKTVTVKVTKGSYSDTKDYTFTVYGIAISTTSLPDGTAGSSYSASLGVTKSLPSGVGSLVYYASNLHSGLAINNSTGVISGTPTAIATKNISVYATQSPYRSATKSLNLTIKTPPNPSFTSDTTIINVSASKLYNGTAAAVGVTIATGTISGSHFNSASGVYFNSNDMNSNSLIFNKPGYSSNSKPAVLVTLGITSDTQINVTVKMNSAGSAYKAATLVSLGYCASATIYTKSKYDGSIATHSLCLKAAL